MNFSVDIAIEYLKIKRFVRGDIDSVYSIQGDKIVVKKFNKHNWNIYGSFSKFKREFSKSLFEEVFYDEEFAFLFSTNKR